MSDDFDEGPRFAPLRWLFRQLRRAVLAIVLLTVLVVALFAVLPVPTTPYMIAESRRLGGVQHDWVGWDDIAPTIKRAVVAGEDANYCNHWGFDMGALRDAIADGARRGGSTISQQTAKNVFLWQGRSYPRKALEALLTPVMELLWSKKRLLHVYLNSIEYDTGVFGIEAAAQHHFGIHARDLNTRQAALLAAVLPDPKGRSAVPPDSLTAARAAAISRGAATIRVDGRDSCFMD